MVRTAWNCVCPSTRWKLPMEILLILFFVLCLIQGLLAQTTTSGGLSGVVSDPSRAVVPDAIVEIRDTTREVVQTAKTDIAGAYRFFFLAPGRYTLTVSRVGFRAESRQVNVLLGPPVTVNFTLEIASENTVVKVTEKSLLIQAENGDVSATMSEKQIS